MNEKIIHRIDQIRKHYGLSYNAFDNLFGFSNGYIGAQIRKERTVGSDVIEKISCHFTEVNLKWFLTGEGKMFETNTTAVNEPEASYISPSTIDKLIDEKIDEKMKVFNKKIDNVISELSLSKKENTKNK